MNYSRINFPEDIKRIAKLDGPIAWYLADSTNKFISVKNKILLDIDIKAAFPTICNVLLKDEMPEFLEQMNNISDKKAKNIFIATSLVNTKYLKQLNLICKLAIMGFVFDVKYNKDILLLELKKDGCLISVTDDILYELTYNKERSFFQFLSDHSFNFHIDHFLKYLRYNKTSIYLKEKENDYDMIIKGRYKYLPSELYNINKEILLERHNNLQYLEKIYNMNYYNIIKKNNLYDLLKKYYICSNDKILNNNGVYEKVKLINSVSPRRYLEIFTFPIILNLHVD